MARIQGPGGRTPGNAGLLIGGVAVLAAWTPAPAPAQGGDFTLEEVVVTARKIEEGLQETPVSITAISGTALAERDIRRIEGISDVAPNVNFSFGGTTSGSSSAAVVYIRGVGQNDFTPVTDPGVGIYVDGVYLARTIGSVLDVLDIERIEVLRGPQGTVFGRNTIGGAVSLTTRDPGDQFRAKLGATFGEDNRYEVNGTIDIPLREDLRLGISGLWRTWDGYVDRADGVELGDDDMFGFRTKLVWDATENLTIKVSADGTHEREESAPEAAIDIPENALFVQFWNNNTFGNGSPDPACAGGGPIGNPNCANDQFAGAPFDSFETGISQNDVETLGLSITAEWELPLFTLKSITAYRDLGAEFGRAPDGTPFPIFQNSDEFDQEQFTQELQISGGLFQERIGYVAGLFYFGEEAKDIGTIVGMPPNFPRLIGGFTDNDSWAIFGELTIDVTDRLQILGGLRFTDEDKRFDATAITVAPGQPAGFDFLTGDAAGEEKINTDELTWRASASYDIGADLQDFDAIAYFTASRGFKSGGFDLRLTQPTTELPRFGPEFVNQFELGLKSELPALGLRWNAAVFFSDYSDIQVSANPPGQINTITANAADGEVLGVEMEATWVPTPALFVEASLGWMDAEYTDINEESNVEVSRSDNFIRTPEWSWSLGASYRINLENFAALEALGGTVTPRLDWIYKKGIDFEPVNSVTSFAGQLGRLVREDEYHNVNLSATYRDAAEKWTLRVGVNNLTDEEYLIAGDSNQTIGYALGVFARERNWYLSVSRVFE